MFGSAMKTFNELVLLLEKVSYKQGWELVVGRTMERPYLQWCFFGPCSVTGEPQRHYCRKWFLSYHMTDGEVVQTAFGAALQAEEHECREFFKYDGKVIMNPHLSLEALVSRAHMTEGRA